MSGLVLPPKVQAEIAKEKWDHQRREQRAMIGHLIDFDDPVCREWQPVLALLDPHLRLGRALPLAYAPGFVTRPGYYHWVRDNPAAPMTVEAITGPDGNSFAEPDQRLLDKLRRNDLQDPRVYAALIGQHAQAEDEREKRLAEDRAEIDNEVMERWAAASRTQVLMSRDVPWAQNSAGRKRRERKS